MDEMTILSVEFKVDREKNCPFLVKMYCRINGHHRVDEFSLERQPIDDEMIVYTWRDASLKELSLLIRDVMGNNEAGEAESVSGTSPDLKFSFKLCYPDPMRANRFIQKDLGWVIDGTSGSAALRHLNIYDSSHKTLDQLRFVPGDYIDVAIYANASMIPKQPELPPKNRLSGNGRFGGRDGRGPRKFT